MGRTRRARIGGKMGKIGIWKGRIGSLKMNLKLELSQGQI